MSQTLHTGGGGGAHITRPVGQTLQRLSVLRGVERKEVGLQTVEGLELPVKQMEQAGWRRAQGSWPGTGEGPAQPQGQEGLVALADSLRHGCFPESQDGQFFPQTRSLGYRLQENGSYMMSLRRVVMEIDGRGTFWGQVQGVYVTGKEELQEGFGEERY